MENLPNYGIITGVTFSYTGVFQRDLSEFLFFCSHGVIIRDKVGNFGRFDVKTLGNELALHTKIVFTQYFALNSQCKACSFSVCIRMKPTFSFTIAGQKLKYGGKTEDLRSFH